MIEQRHMVSGVPVDNNHYVIYPDTIEPVKVKPIFKPNGCCPDALYCPNCNYDLMGGIELDAEHDPPYCWECGMALYWPKRK